LNVCWSDHGKPHGKPWKRGAVSFVFFVVVIAGMVLVIVACLLFIGKATAWEFRASRDRKTLAEVDRDGFPDYRCPKCGVFMTPGFSAADGVFFRTRDEKRKVFAIKRLLPNTRNMTPSLRENMAWRCDACRLLVMDYSCLVGK